MVKFVMKKIFFLDYDNTIAKPRHSPSPEMVIVLNKTLETKKVAIITAGRTEIELRNLLMPYIKEDLLKNLYLCPYYGNKIFSYREDWKNIYSSEIISKERRERISNIIKELNWERYVEHKNHKPLITDRESYLSVDCLGISTEAEKITWDRDRRIRQEIKKELKEEISENIYITGRNTLDIVPNGKTKADNILGLLSLLSYNKNECIYIGDEFYEDGNDYSVSSLGLDIYPVSSPEETKDILSMYI